ncbi:hypothetical protein ER308_00930 [Egibacter rhizosphaerae]|uniref:Uncharacterized protein n=1 Tax=Egibacter rhizosphaerae TaxID=1670831 RepID=A0A411YAN9_9ACTN|nr:hypothetical protein [Egibacter rhizosphaerae]QBI18274.1 hypothetical protein ER308_00930 [Egibacter rhizosphaerae]
MPAVIRLIALAISKTFSKLFGLATITFFGRMPSRDDTKIAAVGLLSLAWIVLPVAVLFPEVGELVLPFLGGDEQLVRTVAAVLLVLVPAVVGGLTAFTVNHRVAGRSTVGQILKGYVYAPIIAVLVVAVLLVVPIVKLRQVARLRDVRHQTIMVRDDDLAECRDRVEAILQRVGLSTRRTEAELPIRALFRGLAWVLSDIFDRKLDGGMLQLTVGVDEREVELTVHGTDLTAVGPRREVAYVMALLNEGISEAPLYLTWDAPGQDLEDRMLALREALERGEPVDERALGRIAEELRWLALGTEAWDAVRRRLFVLERDAARHRAGETVRPDSRAV